MPQERIRTEPFDVRVGWSRDRDVQIGVGEHEDRSLLRVLFGSPENRKRISEELPHLIERLGYGDNAIEQLFNLIESGDPNTGELPHGYSSVWATLERREDCNKLIKLIRKARDQVFGRDE